MLGEEAGRLDQEAGRGDGLLVGQDLAEGDPGAVIDGRVEVVVADAPAAAALGPAVDPVPTAVGDATEFLDVDVDQLAGVLALVRTTTPLARSVWASRLMPWRASTP